MPDTTLPAEWISDGGFKMSDATRARVVRDCAASPAGTVRDGWRFQMHPDGSMHGYGPYSSDRPRVWRRIIRAGDTMQDQNGRLGTVAGYVNGRVWVEWEHGRNCSVSLTEAQIMAVRATDETGTRLPVGCWIDEQIPAEETEALTIRLAARHGYPLTWQVRHALGVTAGLGGHSMRDTDVVADAAQDAIRWLNANRVAPGWRIGWLDGRLLHTTVDVFDALAAGVAQ